MSEKLTSNQHKIVTNVHDSSSETARVGRGYVSPNLTIRRRLAEHVREIIAEMETALPKQKRSLQKKLDSITKLQELADKSKRKEKENG